MSIETGICDALVRILLEERKDQWGNDIQSPLTIELNKWAVEHQADIEAVIIKSFKIEEFADLMVEKLKKTLKSANSWDYDSEKIQNQLKELVLSKMADIIVKEKLEKLKEIDKK